jgi:hypothetical protein
MKKNILNLDLRISNVPVCCDVLSVLLLIICITLLLIGKILTVSGHPMVTVSEQSKLAFLLAIIILISAYNIEIAIIVIIIAIIYVLITNYIKNKEKKPPAPTH